jgi:hypothetical protein
MLGYLPAERTVFGARNSIRKERLAHLGHDMQENQRGIAALRNFLTEPEQRIIRSIQRDDAQNRSEGSRLFRSRLPGETDRPVSGRCDLRRYRSPPQPFPPAIRAGRDSDQVGA